MKKKKPIVRAWALENVITGELFGGVQEVYLRKTKIQVMGFVEWQKRIMKLRQPRYTPVRVIIAKMTARRKPR